MAKDQYDELMNRYLTNQVPENQRILIDAWLDKLVNMKTKNLQLSEQEKEELYQMFVSKHGSLDSVKSFHPNSLKQLERKTWTTRIAAGIILIMILSFAAYRFNTNENSILNNKILLSSQSQKMILKDGSLVWLKQGSEIEYNQKTNERYVEMKGEAFEVAKDPSKPFTIHYNDITLTVYGTSFNFKTGDQIELKVLTGKVRITSSTDSIGLVVVKDEKVTYSTKTGFEKTNLSIAEAKQITSNSEYEMYFEDVKLEEVIER